MEETPAVRLLDHGSGRTYGWAAAGQSGLSGCADGARVPGAGEPWALAQHKWDPARAGAAPPRPAAAPLHPHPAAVAAPGPAAAPPGPHPPAAAAGPPGPGSPAATPPGTPRPGGPPPARQQG